jgi:hypothetical protein
MTTLVQCLGRFGNTLRASAALNPIFRPAPEIHVSGESAGAAVEMTGDPRRSVRPLRSSTASHDICFPTFPGNRVTYLP